MNQMPARHQTPSPVPLLIASQCALVADQSRRVLADGCWDAGSPGDDGGLPRLRRHLWVCLLVGFFLAGGLWGQTEIDRQMEASNQDRAQIENFAGSLVIRGWPGNTVRVTGTLGRDVEALRFERRGDRLEIVVELKNRKRGGAVSSHLEIQVPLGMDLQVETVSAEVTLDGLNGSLRVETVSGDVSVEGAPYEVEIETVSGNVQVLAPTQRLQVEAVSGDVRLVGVMGHVKVATVSGDIDIRSGQMRGLQADVVSGDLNFSGAPSAGSHLEMSSHSGDLLLSLPPSTAATFEVQTFSGDIDNQLGPAARRTSRYTSAKELVFTLGGGGAQVDIESFSGHISLRPRE